MKRQINFKAVILAGGNGERFWPLSTPMRPKQFMTLFGRKSMIAETVSRLRGICSPENTFVVTARRFVSVTTAELPDVPRKNIIGEPMRRDTCAAVALGVTRAGSGDSDVIGFFPSDHLIGNVGEFKKVLRKAILIASREDVIVVIGIKPTCPATGFGYINPTSGRFVEKPSEKKAEEYLRQGYLWNAGLFIARAKIFKSAFATVAPGLINVHLSDYASLPRISFDYAVMEKISNICVLPGDFGWDDVGSYRALEKHFPVDENGNVRIGTTRAVASNHVSLVSCGTPITVLGVSNVVVVSTPQQVLVVDKDHLDEMKRLFLKD